MKTSNSAYDGILRHFLALATLLCFSTFVSAQVVEKDSTNWFGEWADDGNLHYSFKLSLHPVGDGGMVGVFEWKLIWTWLPEHKAKIGAVAKEYVVGAYDPLKKELNLRGVRQNDPLDIISMDIYRIQIVDEGMRLVGVNLKPENYKGSMYGYKMVYKPPVLASNEKVQKKEEKSKPIGPVEDKKSAVKTIAEQPQPSPLEDSLPSPIVAVKESEAMESREIVTKQAFNATAEKVHIKIYDPSMVDGDVISLNWNGIWILRYYKVGKLPKEMYLPLNQGENRLVMHAENLGRYPPNTAAITVTQGEKSETIILNSDLGKSEALVFVRKQK